MSNFAVGVANKKGILINIHFIGDFLIYHSIADDKLLSTISYKLCKYLQDLAIPFQSMDYLGKKLVFEVRTRAFTCTKPLLAFLIDISGWTRRQWLVTSNK